jgi:hypothetical protein
MTEMHAVCAGPNDKNAAFPKGKGGVLFDRDTVKRKDLSLAGLAATYSPRA